METNLNILGVVLSPPVLQRGEREARAGAKILIKGVSFDWDKARGSV